MQFFNVKRSTKSTITFTFAELKKLEETEHSCVEKVTQNLHLTLLPFHLSNISSSISEILSSNITKYNKDLDGILLGYKNVRVLDSTPAIHNDNCLVHVTVDAEFYLFKPCEGKTLIGFVNQISDDHIGCLVHKAFNVVVPKEQNGRLVKKYQHILVKVSNTNLEAKLPFIKADLISIISDTDSGISTSEENHLDTSVSQDIPEVFIKKNKASKKVIDNVFGEEIETTSEVYLDNDKIDGIRSKKKKAKKQRCDELPDEDCVDRYEQHPKATDHDNSYRTLESYLSEYLHQKKKKKKKSKSSECEDREEFLPKKLNEVDNYRDNDQGQSDVSSSIKKAKKKKSKDNKEETQYEDTESLAFVPEVKLKRHKKKKIFSDEPDNDSSKSLEVDQKNPFRLAEQDYGETEQLPRQEEHLRSKSPKFKILQNVTITKPDPELKLKEGTLEKITKNKHDGKDFEDFSEDIKRRTKKKKHKNTKKGDLEDFVDDQDLKGELFQSTFEDFNKNDVTVVEKDNKYKKLKTEKGDKYLDKSNEDKIGLVQDLMHKALDGIEDLNKIKKHKKSKKRNSDELINKSEDVIDDSRTDERTLVGATNTKKNKKHKRHKRDSFNQDLDESKGNTFDLIEDLKRKVLENALGSSEESVKTKKHKKSKQDNLKNAFDMHDSNKDIVENMEDLNKKSKHKKSNDSTTDLIEDLKRKAIESTLAIENKKSKHKKSKDKERENLIILNDSTVNLIEDLKRKAIENTLGEDNRKSKHKKLQKLAEMGDLKQKAVENIAKDSGNKEDNLATIINTNVDFTKNKKTEKADKYDKQKSSTEHLNISEPEIDDIRHTALAQALSRITETETKAPKKKKKKHKDEIDISELKSQTLQKILGNLNEDEISSHSKKKKKKKEKGDIDIDKMKQMAMDKLLDKNIMEDDSSREDSEQLKRHKKSSKKREKPSEILTFEQMFGDDQSKHKVKRKKKEKD